jgi:hypothetical protein
MIERQKEKQTYLHSSTEKTKKTKCFSPPSFSVALTLRTRYHSPQRKSRSGSPSNKEQPSPDQHTKKTDQTQLFHHALSLSFSQSLSLSPSALNTKTEANAKPTGPLKMEEN